MKEWTNILLWEDKINTFSMWIYGMDYEGKEVFFILEGKIIYTHFSMSSVLSEKCFILLCSNEDQWNNMQLVRLIKHNLSEKLGGG